MSNPLYSAFFQIKLDAETEDWVQQKAKWYADQMTPFARLGMYWNFVMPCCPLRGDKTLFCSQYIVILLQCANMLPHLDPDRTSPTRLFEELKKSEFATMAINRGLGQRTIRPNY